MRFTHSSGSVADQIKISSSTAAATGSDCGITNRPGLVLRAMNSAKCRAWFFDHGRQALDRLLPLLPIHPDRQPLENPLSSRFEKMAGSRRIVASRMIWLRSASA